MKVAGLGVGTGVGMELQPRNVAMDTANPQLKSAESAFDTSLGRSPRKRAYERTEG